MAWDDPVVIGLILLVVILLFGASRIPSLARSLGQARREFDKGSKGEGTPAAAPITQDDPLFIAAQKEGIETQGKTREQVASELSWKLSKK
jgi:sec-independent protein translocase protein TatA